MTNPPKEPCPYKSLPDTSFWRRSVSQANPLLLDPVVSTKFKIGQEDLIATAGSCFAQHIANFLSKSGYRYLVTEKGHPVLSEQQRTTYNYGTFTARYGNLYTTRQLLQLLQRAYGELEPKEDIWEDGGRYFDPFRPFIQPNGFSSKAEFLADREVHFAAIRQMVDEMDVFVFTLGLTEGWVSKEDGIVFAISPGCGAGKHNSSQHQFINFSAEETTSDLRKAINLIKKYNPECKTLLTVSPVPLIATYEPQHVLVSTTYSKSVLRVVAETLKNEMEIVDYFPSYEIITGNFSRAAYFEEDLREVRMTGVKHAMTCFFRHYLDVEISEEIFSNSSKIPNNSSTANDRNASIAQVICDEEELEKAT